MTASLRDRLLARSVRDEATGCLRWTGCHNSRGYGVISVDGTRQLVHRMSYEVHYGEIAEGLTIDHVAARGCRHKDCIEPSHLEAVTNAENQARTAEATKTHCKHGHEYTPENTMLKQRRNGGTIRNCRTCNRIQQSARAFAREYLDRPLTRAEMDEWIARRSA